jgi:hypothetical protein
MSENSAFEISANAQPIRKNALLKKNGTGRLTLVECVSFIECLTLYFK